jgi:uncharacterized protein
VSRVFPSASGLTYDPSESILTVEDGRLLAEGPMVKTRAEILRMLDELRNGCLALYGERLKGIYLYGSYARDEAQEDSDIDVAIVLRGPLDAAEEGRRTCGLVGDLSLRGNCLIAVFFLTEEEYKKTPYAIHRSIVREGVPA